MMRYLLPLLLLAGCGGGGEPPPGPVRAMLDTERVWRVAGWGDSTQRGSDTGTSAIAEAALLLSFRWELNNYGVSGSYAQQLLQGTGNQWTVHFENNPEAIAAEFVLFRFAINDRRYYDADQFYAIMNRLVNITEGRRQIAVIETPSPVTKATMVEGVAANVEKLRLLASRHPNAVLCDHNANGYINGFENYDEVHPTAYAYQTWQGPDLAQCLRDARAKWIALYDVPNSP